MNASILVAGLGNIFLGDDGFGVEVVRCLMARPSRPHVLIKDFGIRGFDLAYALLEPWQAVILIDTLRRGHAPGTLYLFQPGLPSSLASDSITLNLHSMDPLRVLSLAASLGTISAPVTIIGCEPNDFGDELEGRMGLSPAVGAAVEEAATIAEQWSTMLLHGQTREHLPVLEKQLERSLT